MCVVTKMDLLTGDEKARERVLQQMDPTTSKTKIVPHGYHGVICRFEDSTFEQACLKEDRIFTGPEFEEFATRNLVGCKALAGKLHGVRWGTVSVRHDGSPEHRLDTMGKQIVSGCA